jgi:tRNA modification GTPase
MRVTLRALSTSRSSRAFRALSTNALRGQNGRFAVCAQLLPVQRRSVRNFGDRERNDLKDFNSGFTSISQVSDTIYALSTAAGRAAIAVIRVSGPACLDVRLGVGRRPVLC